MSAKDLRKAIRLRLDADLDAALRRYAVRRGARTLAGAARSALREASDARAIGVAGPPSTASRPRPRVLRLQLEPSLRAAVAASEGACDADGVARRLRAALLPNP